MKAYIVYDSIGDDLGLKASSARYAAHRSMPSVKATEFRQVDPLMESWVRKVVCGNRTWYFALDFTTETTRKEAEYVAADHAYDAAREDRIFGRR